MGIIVDTSVWADHFRSSDERLVRLIVAGEAQMHPFVIGELAMGNLRDRRRTIAALMTLPAAIVATQTAWLDFVDRAALGGTGIGFVDAHLLLSAELGSTMLWTRDRRLTDHATTLGRNWPA